jgi:hypothetical protein
MFLYADDASLMSVFENIREATISINRDLQSLSVWAITWRVIVNAIKTVFMIMSKKRYPPRPVLYLDNTQLKQVDEECYLGMILTSNMSWKKHIHKITTKASTRLGLLFKVKNYIPRPALSNYYTTFVRPILEYGNVTFDNCTAFEANSLEQVQRLAAVICTGSFKRSSYNLLLKDLGWDTIQNRRQNAKLILMFKIINNLTPNYLKELIPPRTE